MRRYLLFFASVLLFASCSRPEVSDNNNKDTKDQMRFAASVPAKEADWNSASANAADRSSASANAADRSSALANEPSAANGGASRGAVTDGTSISEFGVFCFNTARSPWASAGATALPNKLFDVEVRRTPSTNDWAYNPPVEWQGGDGSLFTFFGYSPRATGLYEEPDYPDGNNIELASTVDTPGVPTIRYTTIDYVPMQVDLLVAKPVYDTRPVDKVRMQFAHALSQIRFTGWAAQNFVRVTSIEISDIKYKATLSLDDGALTPETDVKTFVLDNINRTLSTDELKPTDLSDGANAFMLLPQDLTGNTTAMITATYEVGGETKTSKPYLIVQNWEPNKAYTYVFNLGGNPTEEMIITDVTMTDWVVDSEEDMATTPPTYRPMPPAANQIVEIDGLKWTTGNLVAKDAFNCKVGAPEDGGLYFQFGSLIGWKGGATGDGTGRAAQATDSFYNGTTFDATGEVAIVPKTFSRISNIGVTWPNNAGTNLYYFGHNTTPYETQGTNIQDYPGVLDGSLAADGVGDPCRYYLGGEWRLPTAEEFQVMHDAIITKSYPGTWTAGSSTDSYFVGTFSSGAELKFPAVGLRRSDNLQGAFSNVGQVGYYWSSSVAFNVAGLQFSFGNGGAVVQDAYERYGGLAVRCVSGTYVNPIPPHNPQEPAADQIVEIDGLQWTTGNLVARDASNCKVGAPEDGGLYFQFGSLLGWKGGGTGDGTGRAAKATGSYYNGTTFDATGEVEVVPETFRKITSIGTTWPNNAGTNSYYFGHNTAPYETDGTNIQDFEGVLNGALASDGVGDPCAYYLGGTWRLPTTEEFQIMSDAATKSWTGTWTAGSSTDSYAVWTFSDNKEVKFPAVGMRSSGSFGKLTNVGGDAYYWSSSVYDNIMGLSYFSRINTLLKKSTSIRSIGMPVRCVSGTYVKPVPEVNGVVWATGNLVADGANGAKIGAPEDGGLYFQFGSLLGWKGGATGDGTGRPAKSGTWFYDGTSFNAANEVAVVPATFSQITNINTRWPNQEGNNLYYFGHNASPYETDGTNIQDYTGVLDGSLAANGVGDPCRYYLGAPWRLPTNDEFQAMDNAATKTRLGTWALASTDSYVVATFANGTELKFPAVGFRQTAYNGAVDAVGTTGYYWSSSVNSSTNGSHSYITTNGFRHGNFNRRFGILVRCVRDK